MTARLIVLTGHDIGKEVALAGSATLGRLPGCTLMLIGNAVSREHAKVFEKDGRFFVVDLNSSNGTRVNGDKVTRHELRDGDEIQLGDQRVRFKLGAPAEVVPEELEFGDAAPAAPAVTPEEPTVAVRAPAAPAVPDIDVRPRAPAAAAASTAAAPAASAKVHSRDRVLQYHKVEDKGGLLAEDLSQRGPWFRLMVWLLVLALSVGVVWGIQHLMQGSGEEPAAPTEPEGR